MKSLLAIAATAALCLAPASTSSAQDGQDTGALLVVMDISGSMNEDDGSGAPRIEGARNAVNDLIEAVPQGTRIGLRTYGDEYDGDDQEQGCQDTRLAVPIGPVEDTGPDISAEVEDATPTGFTPIGHSLEQAGGDFTDEANRSIVLVSDGEDTCGQPPPCEVAQELTSSGIEVRVDTIGLAIEDNPTAQGELECIAEATGGEFVQVADAAELTERLSRVSTRAIEGWSAEGEEVDGGPIVTQATPIEPGTTYVDDVVDGEARWYSFPVQEGQDVTVTMSEDGSLDYGCCVELRLYRPDQQSDFGREGGYSDEVPKIYRTGTREAGAQESGTYYASVVLDDDTGSEEGTLTYQLEAIVAGEDSEADQTATQTGPTGDADTSAPETGSSADEASTAGPQESQTTADPDEDTAASQSDAASSDDGNALLLTLIIVLGVAVAALGGAVVYLLVRMNRGSG